MLGALTLLCWLLAHWTWVILQPQTVRAEPALPGVTDLRAARDAVIGARLFGLQGEAGAEAKPVTTLNLKLRGVFAAHVRSGSYAVLSLNDKPAEVTAEGGEVSSGIVLYAVHRDHVVIRRQGVLERVDFPETARAGSSGGFNLEVRKTGAAEYSFSRDTLNQALQSPGQLAQLGTLTVSPGAGVTISQAPPGSLAQKLSLQPGDRIERVNGQGVETYEDLARLYQQFTSTGQVTLEGSRGGAPLKLSYTVQP